ncbi:hypothetical protein ABT288_46620, partial [Streptomyces sp. NPDC001093]
PLAPDADALVDRVADAIADFRAAGGTIGHVRGAFTEEDWAAIPETNKSFSAVAAARGTRSLQRQLSQGPKA